MVTIFISFLLAGNTHFSLFERKGNPMRPIVLALAALLAVTSAPAMAATDSDGAPANVAVLKAENRLLRKELAAARKRIKELEARLTELESRHAPEADAGAADDPENAGPAAGTDDETPKRPEPESTAKQADAATDPVEVDFFGLRTQDAKRVAFVVDRSGSMTDSIAYVKGELKRSVGRLKPEQEFYITFYSSGPAAEMPGGKPLPATAMNKQQVAEFIDGIKPRGQTDPTDALKHTLAMRPDVIYLLTDGEFEDDVPAFIRRYNHRLGTPINTLCFIYIGGERMLKQIADENGGRYKYVSETEAMAADKASSAP